MTPMLYASLCESNTRQPGGVALTSNGSRLTYAELLDAVNYCAERLGEWGLESGHTVGLVLNNSFEFVICLYALTKRRVEVVLVNPQNSADKLYRMLRAVPLDAVIMENHIEQTLLQAGIRIPAPLTLLRKEHLHICFPEGHSGGQPDMAQADGMEPGGQASAAASYRPGGDDETVVIQCSSGTTGQPKMAVRTQRNVAADARNILSSFGYTSRDIVYCPVPVCHGYGLTMGLIAPLKAGAHIWLERWFMPNRLLAGLPETQPTVFLGTPEMYDILAQSPLPVEEAHFGHMRLLLCSGSPLEKQIGISFHGRFGRWIQQLYGMMEVSTIACNFAPDVHSFTSVGKAVDNVQIRIGEREEIFVRSETVSPIYIREQISYATGDREWFATGDRGYLDEEGRLYITERIAIETETIGGKL
jgi:long-chain acyl-CoA synthetase